MVTLAALQKLKKKYNVIGCATKKEISETLWGLRKHVMEIADVEAIKPFLKPADQRKAQQLINQAERNPIQSYMGLWKPKPMPVAKMSRQRIAKERRQRLRSYDCGCRPADRRIKQRLDFSCGVGRKSKN